MKNLSKPLLLTALGGILFYQLFWEESLGINLLLYTFMLIAGTVFSKKMLSPPAIISGIGCVGAASFWVLHATTPAFLGWLASLLLFVGFSQHYELKSSLYAYSAAIRLALKVPKILRSQLSSLSIYSPDGKSSGRWIGIVAFPILAFIVFFCLFRAANPTFEALTNQLFEPIGDLFAAIFSWSIFFKLLFVLIGMLASGWVFLRLRSESVVRHEKSQSEALSRNRAISRKQLPAFAISTIALKNEHTTASILMATVGGMAACVNLIDLTTLWFGFEYDGSQNLSQLVHEGTYLLICSILLSMGIMLYYFRGNQNFYSKSNGLRWLAYIWLVQNAFMVLSVAVRNYHYIHYFGLAYKRIGVLFFLGLTLFGLWSLFWKIKYRRSVYFLLRHNSWAAYALLLLMGTANWDCLIAEHNLSHWNKEGIDREFLLELSDKALPILDRNREVFEGYRFYDGLAIRELDWRVQQLKERPEASWLSWTWANERARKHFEEK